MANGSVNLTGLQVLVLEDNYLIAEVIREQLEDCGCKIIGPTFGVDEALKLVGSTFLDGALLDVNLAGEFCFPVAAALKERKVPFVFLSGLADVRTMPIEFRAVPQIMKPFDYAKLTQLVADYFRPHRKVDVT